MDNGRKERKRIVESRTKRIEEKKKIVDKEKEESIKIEEYNNRRYIEVRRKCIQNKEV